MSLKRGRPTSTKAPKSHNGFDQKDGDYKSLDQKVRLPSGSLDMRVHTEDIKDTTVIHEDEYKAPIKRKTPPYMSQFELCGLIRARLIQLSSPNGMPLLPKSEIEGLDALQIAKKEVYARLPPLVIRRTLSDGSTEDWLLTDRKNAMEFPRI